MRNSASQKAEKLGRIIEIEKLGKIIEIEVKDIGCKSESKDN